MVGAVHVPTPHATIYNTPQESLRSGTPSSNIGGTKVGLRSIQQLVQESETTQENMTTYSDPMDDASDSGGSTPPPSSPPPSSGSSGGGYGY